MGYPDLKAIRKDVEDGLKSQTPRLAEAAMAQKFWDYRGKTEMMAFLRDAETPFDYVSRPYRASGLVRQLIEVLCEHLYSPGPTRTWDDDQGNEFLQKVYEDNHFDAMMLRADQLSSLSDIAAVQVDANEGVFQDKPITLRLWGAQDFAVWTDPENRTVPKCACTIDRYDTETWYRLWTDETVERYKEPKGEEKAGESVAKFVDSTPHDYGCLPFAFVHYVQPITTFWETGIGMMLTQGEIRVNDRLSRLDESINKHLNPLAIAENVDDMWQPVIEPQRFMRISNSKIRPGPTGGYEGGDPPHLYYLEAHIDIAGAWDDLLKYLNQLLQALKVPASAVRMEQQGFTSGIALIVEQAPLLTRARARRKPFALYETEIARTILRCAGGHYGNAGFVTSAKEGKLTLGWSQPTVPVPTADNLELLLAQVTAGIKSLPMVVSEWMGVDREGAFQILEQVEEDNAEMKQRVPTLVPEEGQQQDDQGGDGSSPNGNGKDKKQAGEGEDKPNGKLKQLIVEV